MLGLTWDSVVNYFTGSGWGDDSSDPLGVGAGAAGYSGPNLDAQPASSGASWQTWATVAAVIVVLFLVVVLVHQVEELI